MIQADDWAGRLMASLALALCLVPLVSSATMAECGKLDRELRSAVTARALDLFGDLHKRMLADPSCDGSYRDRVGRVLALTTLLKIHAEAREGGASMPLDKLRQAASFGQPWQVMTALGDRLYDQEQWAGAVRAYEAALDDMRSETANPKPPPKEIEQRVVKRAYQARALAPIYVATRRFRGRPGGLASPTFRNFSVETVPVPVKFDYNESTMTEEGEKAAADILDYLQDQNAKKVRLAGHTDPRGSEDYNIKLSGARAEAVKSFLVEKGFEGEITVVGAGESERFEPDDAAKYSEEQRFTFDRRVEYQILE